MFQDGSVKTILTSSNNPLNSTLTQPTQNAETFCTAFGENRVQLASLRCQTARMFVSAPLGNAVEFISTASASTISGLLTLFSKCFSSFLHSTCSLSVSYSYLALEEVYLPLSALVSEYTTLWKQPGRLRHHRRGSHPLWRSARGHFCAGSR